MIIVVVSSPQDRPEPEQAEQSGLPGPPASNGLPRVVLLVPWSPGAERFPQTIKREVGEGRNKDAMQNKGCVPGEIISPSDRVVVDDGMVKTQSLSFAIPDWGCEDWRYLYLLQQ